MRCGKGHSGQMPSAFTSLVLVPSRAEPNDCVALTDSVVLSFVLKGIQK